MVAGGEGYGYGKSTVMVAWNVLERGCKGKGSANCCEEGFGCGGNVFVNKYMVAKKGCSWGGGNGCMGGP
jgi:hypothetical protein